MLYNPLQQERFYVYIIQCADKSYYVGLTDDLIRRFTEHAEGYYANCYTFKKRPLELKYYETIPFLKDAIEREQQIKKWSRKKKEMLIKQDYHRLQLLAQCQNLSHSKYKEFRQ